MKHIPNRLGYFALLLIWVMGGVSCQSTTPTAVPTQMAAAAVPTFMNTAVPHPATTAVPSPPAPATPTPIATAIITPTVAPPTATFTPTATLPPAPTPSPIPSGPSITTDTSNTEILGYSTQGRPIINYRFGNGAIPIVLVGGIHGGYEWNTIILAYRMIDYFSQNPTAVPESVALHIIPSANPDGQFLATGKDGRFAPADVDTTTNNFVGRFNGNGVDLNRNWDCNWQATATWRDQQISGGAYPFSEPETVVLRDFLVNLNPTAVVFWHSAADAVFAAGCPNLYQPAYDLAQLYGNASGYPVYEAFNSYAVTGDASDWLSLQGIPAISVELETHESLDWEANMGGVTAVLATYGNFTPPTQEEPAE